jgi:hypothetical protein
MEKQDILLRFDSDDFENDEVLLDTIRSMIHLFGQRKMKKIIHSEMKQTTNNRIIVEVTFPIKMMLKR